MTTETLSDKIIKETSWWRANILVDDVKEAIKKLKEILEDKLDVSDRENEGVVCHDFEKCWNEAVDEILGEELTGK